MANGPFMGAIGLCFCIIITWLPITWQEHPSFIHPVHAAITAFFIAGIVLLAISRTNIPTRLGRGRGGAGREYRSHGGGISATPARIAIAPAQLTPQRRRLVFSLLVFCTVIRVGTLRKISEAAQCSARDLEVISLPIIFAIYDFVTSPPNYNADDIRDSISNSALEDLFDTIRWSRVRYIVPTILLTLGIYLTSSRLPSAFVCSQALNQRSYTICLQVVGIGLDCIIIVVLSQLLAGCNDDKRRTSMLGYIMMASAALLSAAAFLYLIVHPFQITAILSTPSSFKYSIFIDGMALTALIFCVAYLNSDLRPFAVVMTIVFTTVMAPLVANAWSEKRPFPPQSDTSRILGVASLVFGYMSFIIIYKYGEAAKQPQNILNRVHAIFYILLAVAFIYTETVFIWRSNKAGFHPVRLLVYQGQVNANAWSKQASSSKNLTAAVDEYKSRYHRLPPPNFDKWFEYAKDRNCTTIDDYDQIYEDLLPFWGVKPALIRKQSTIKRKNSSFISIQIDMGKVNTVHVSEEYSHLDDPIINMIKSFATWLPQMQIVLNPSPSPQIALPRSSLAKLESAGHRSEHIEERETIITTWATLSKWGPLTAVESGLPVPPMARHISRWDAYMAPTCSSNSPARSHPHSSRTLCTSCFASYSAGQFIRDISHSLDPCLQSDLRTVSSFLSSPATVPNTGYPADKLIPIFSSRKIEGYNDILFPLPGTYVPSGPASNPDLSLSVPGQKPFAELRDVLYWRGEAPPSGLGAHSWQGVSEQRLVTLAHQAPSNYKIPILVPFDTEGKKHEYGYVRLAAISDQIQVDAGFTGVPEKNCHREEECQEQRKHFGTNATLSDSDEDRYSSRYILTTDVSEPKEFLKNVVSGSVAVRSGIFKSWYEKRLTPWIHYIPLDMRWQGLHSTMAYFMGLSGTVKGEQVSMDAQVREAKLIAEQGKARAESMVREADAEVYLFRLLLEWGRIVDDYRDEVGFVLKE
ncbi:hypothetical protein V499_02021 [Pseudogymnoascus sp. VKM F-103]|uniref:Glycosyl transferase CAP10 domain-containing protein n=1 Tax=Pseudogymnoascus verrucosus TaxID=342668 RepID=A0A1B8GA88_9PEZI|nr:uncharacterized protein VE01_09168 [Pseudogymnoascus verrucosus]KFY78937.1 hypothetical protein V499_02021 [Pseudogymnoascus sp. VKM F-103]OBT92740.2 hypothetical protein VE01_09168 [Pseudogymnoascus verrucosus]